MTAIILLATLLAQPEDYNIYHRMARFVREYEIKELEKVPSWYPPGEVRFRFVQVTDVHLNRQREKSLEKACSFINKQVRPAFVVFTGDNSGGSDISRQEHFRDLVERLLEAPFFVLRGDNWARNFTGVFGSFQWSFDCGGIHFIGSGLDVDVENLGIGHFLPETLGWLKGELEKSARRPVVYFQHENIQPPTFLDAGRLDGLFESSGNVLLTLTGHLHRDLESRTGRVLHVVGPALGPHPRHGFKVVEVYGDQLVVRTVELVEGAYRYVRKYQRVRIPEELGKGLKREKAEISHLKKRPPRDTTFDSSLLLRQPEIGIVLFQYASKTGKLGELLKALSPGENSKPPRPSPEEGKGGDGKKGEKKTEKGGPIPAPQTGKDASS